MRTDIAEVLAATGGVADLGQLLARVPERSLRRAVARGDLVRVQPRMYAAAEAVPRAMAAVRSTGGALSHATALIAWDLAPAEPGADIRLTVARHCGPRPRPGVVIHRTEPLPPVVERHGLPVVGLDRTLVDCWAVLPEAQRRAAVIRAVSGRRTTAARVGAVLATRAHIRAAASLADLLTMLDSGCHSELEIWGLQRVLVIPGLPRPRHQIRVAVQSRVAYLDAGWEDVRLAIEFDGAGTHGGDHRERDLRRDTWLASLGWLVLRYSYRRLVDDPIAVRAEITAAYDVRRVQFRGS